MLARRLLLTLLLATPLAADWPRFRGPDGAGTSADKDVPVRWAANNVLFKAKLPGAGHSSPIVVGDRAILLSATDDERLVICLDAKTGKQKWVKKVPGQLGKTHAKSSLASSTPCSDGKQVYCVFWDGNNVGLYAYDLDGKLAWEADLGPFKSQHGPGFSPMLYQDGKASLVIVNNDQDGSARLMAFGTADGKLKWQKERKAYRACYSTPLLHKAGKGETQLIVTSTAGLTGYAPATGEELWAYTWQFPVKPLRTVGSTVVAGGMAFACGGDGDGSRAMVAIKLGGTGDVSKTATVWSLESQTPYVPTILAKGDHLYTVNDDGTAICRVAKTGEVKWRQRLTESAVSASPVLIDGKVYVLSEKGEVFVFEATPDGYKPLAKNSVGEAVMSSPAVANGRLYVRGSGHLFCIGKP